MPFKDFNYMYSSFLIQRCHLYYFLSSQTRANTQTYARSLANSLTDALSFSPMLGLSLLMLLKAPIYVPQAHRSW